MKTTLDQMLFPVVKAPVLSTSGIKTLASNAYGIYGDIDRNGDPYLLNTCTDIYELLPNEDLFPRIEQILKENGIPFTVQYRMIDHTRFYADYAIKTGSVTVGDKKDEIFPLIRVEHSYNGLLSYKMYFGYFRMICSNGLVIPVADKETTNLVVKGKHTKKILESLNRLIDKIDFFSKNHKKFVMPFEIMADTWVSNWEERVLEVATATAVGLRGVKAIFEKGEDKKNTETILGYEGQIIERISYEAGKLYGNGGSVNEWLIYNGFNYHIFNATTKATEDKASREYDTAYELRVDQDRKVLKEILAAH